MLLQRSSRYSAPEDDLCIATRYSAHGVTFSCFFVRLKNSSKKNISVYHWYVGSQAKSKEIPEKTNWEKVGLPIANGVDDLRIHFKKSCQDERSRG